VALLPKKKTRIIMKTLLLAAAGLLVASASFAQTNTNPLTNSASIPAYARVIRPLTVHADEDVNFGAIYIPGTGNAVVTVAPNGSITGTAGSLVGTGANIQANNDPDNDGVEAGGITVSGEAGFHYSLATTFGAMTMTGGSNAPTLSAAVYSPSNGLLSGSITTPGVGTEALTVGATITVPSNVTPGKWVGSITTVATYQ